MILIDANIFMYAAGRESPQRLPCQRFLEKIVAGEGPAACTDAVRLRAPVRALNRTAADLRRRR
ncbi:MAG TPA: hypothetical protein VFE33_18110 [Thermoanaerobaculia bacterium]|nr:hypothetical protein [Thermoanaerobaculia bacterium]